MNIQNISQNFIEFILQFLSYYELRSIYLLSKAMSLKLLHYIKGNQIKLHCRLKLPDLSDFSRLTKLSLYMSSNDLKEAKHTIQFIPKTVQRLSLQLDKIIASQLEFYQSIPKYQPQLTHLLLNIMQSEIQMELPSEEEINKQFYQKMLKLKKLKVLTHEHIQSNEYDIHNILFMALFIKGQQPSIQNIYFDRISSNSESYKHLLVNNQLQKNTTITSITLKSYHSGHSFQEDLPKLCQLFGQQVLKLSITNKSLDYLLEKANGFWEVLSDKQITEFLQYFINLQCIFLNIYPLKYELQSFQIESLSKLLKLNKLGLCGLQLPPQHFRVMLADMDLTTIDLGFTSIDDSCLDMISNYKNLKELSLNNCKGLSNKALTYFMRKQTKLIKLDIRGLISFDQLAFKELNSNTYLERLKLSFNTMDSMTVLQLLRRHCYSLKQFTFLQFRPKLNLAEAFKLAVQNIVCIHLIKLRVRFLEDCLEVETLRDLLRIFPNTRILSVNLDLERDQNQLFEILATVKLQSLEELRINGYQYNEGQNDVALIQKLRDNLPSLHTVYVNTKFYELETALKLTVGNKVLRIMLITRATEYD